jgi:RNA polymerase sigma factor (sigma-70 family)
LNVHTKPAGKRHLNNSQFDRLTEALRNNEDWAVTEISRRVTPIVRNKIYSFDDWEDVLQECLMEVVAAVKACTVVNNLWGLVKRVAITSVIDHNRATQKSRERHSNPPAGGEGETDNPTARLPDRRPLPDAVLESRDLFLYIYQRIGKTCRQIIDLIYINGVTYQRAAGELGIEEGALRVRIHRCRERAMRMRAEAVAA